MSSGVPWRDRLRLPLIVAPMTGVSGADLVVAACANGVIGAFPAHNAGGIDGLDGWLTEIRRRLDDDHHTTGWPWPAPVAVNLIVHRSNALLDEQVACVRRHGVELVIASVGAPDRVIDPLHDAGCLVYADVASLRHVDRAIELGADGLVLLTAGAGGQTGRANPFAFVRAVRERFDGSIVLAGGISDGTALAAARRLGCDLAFMGTRFIATEESLADDDYRDALVRSTLDDVALSSELTGLPANVLAASLPSADDRARSPDRAHVELGAILGSARPDRAPNRVDGVHSAGHSVSAVDGVSTVADLVDRLHAEYDASRRS